MELAFQDTQVPLSLLEDIKKSCEALQYQPNTFGFDKTCDIRFTEVIDKPTLLFGGTKILNLLLKNKLPKNCVVFYDELTFDQKHYRNILKEELVNNLCFFYTWGTIKNWEVTRPVFVKPSSDIKYFNNSAIVLYPKDNKTIFELLSENKTLFDSLHDEVNFLINYDIQTIDAEFRCVVVDNKLIDISQYNEKGKLCAKQLSDDIRQQVTDYIFEIMRLYQPLSFLCIRRMPN